MALFRKNETRGMTLDELVEAQRQTHGHDLRAVVLYGSAASGEDVEGHSDLNVLVLVDRLPVARLREEAHANRGWVQAGNPPPFTLTMAEWRASADIFPMEYSDILSSHRVLHGEAPFGDVSVKPEDLRLELEREAVGKLIHLRQGILQAGGDPAGEVRLLVVAFSTFMAISRGLLRLHDENIPRDQAGVVRRTGELAGFDSAPVLRVLEHRRGERELGGDEIPRVVEGYLMAAQQLAFHVDTLWRSAEGRSGSTLGSS